MTDGQYIVIALTASLPSYQSCSVVKYGDPYIQTHSQVFGPRSKQECEDWLNQNCGK